MIGRPIMRQVASLEVGSTFWYRPEVSGVGPVLYQRLLETKEATGNEAVMVCEPGKDLIGYLPGTTEVLVSLDLYEVLEVAQ